MYRERERDREEGEGINNKRKRLAKRNPLAKWHDVARGNTAAEFQSLRSRILQTAFSAMDAV